MKKYFLHDGSQQAGPFDIEELKSKNLNRETPIWYEGLEEWTAISKIAELKEIIISTPPPFTAKLASPPPVEKPVAQQKVFVNKPKQSRSTARRLLIIGGLIVLALIGLFIYNQIQHQQYQQDRESTINAEEDTKAMIKKNITSYVTAERNEYTFNELGGISNLKISVTNSTDYVLDNVQVKVIYIKANGEVWDSKIVDFNMIDRQTKSTIKVGDTERGTSVQFEIVSIKSNALGLN
jgi:hypothetical protein